MNEFSSDSPWQPLEFRTVQNLEYSGASVAGCPDRQIPECPPGNDNQADKTRVFRFEVPAVEWDSKKQRMAFIAAIETDDDKILAKQILESQGSGSQSFTTQPIQPESFDINSPHECVVRDNNVTLWTSPEPESSNCLCIGGAVAAILLLLLI